MKDELVELSRDAAMEREAVLRWLYATADTARKMWDGDDEYCTSMRRHVAGTIQINADAIARGLHRRPPSPCTHSAAAEKQP